MSLFLPRHRCSNIFPPLSFFFFLFFLCVTPALWSPESCPFSTAAPGPSFTFERRSSFFYFFYLSIYLKSIANFSSSRSLPIYLYLCISPSPSPSSFSPFFPSPRSAPPRSAPLHLFDPPSTPYSTVSTYRARTRFLVSLFLPGLPSASRHM